MVVFAYGLQSFEIERGSPFEASEASEAYGGNGFNTEQRRKRRRTETFGWRRDVLKLLDAPVGRFAPYRSSLSR